MDAASDVPTTGRTRRSFLGQAAALPLAGLLPATVFARPPAEGQPGLVVRQRVPENLEFSFPSLDGVAVPNERFYVRNHFRAPEIRLDRWTLEVTGNVRRELSLRFEDLARRNQKSLVSTMECAGNGRVFLDPKVRGVNWELGAIGTAEWTGIPLAELLQEAGVVPGAVEVILEGADTGAINDDPKTPGPIPYSRSIPLEKAQSPSVLLATRMNGEALPPSHGYPVRAMVAGWYGMACVKWLKRIIVTDRPFQGYFQSFDYTIYEPREGGPSITPLTGMQVKSQIARPALGEVVQANALYRVFGAAWAGEEEVARVEVSTDGGTRWVPARLLGDSTPYTWRLWEFSWRVPGQPGTAILMSRATDRKGNQQPKERDPNRRTYMINHVVPMQVDVR